MTDLGNDALVRTEWYAGAYSTFADGDPVNDTSFDWEPARARIALRDISNQGVGPRAEITIYTTSITDNLHRAISAEIDRGDARLIIRALRQWRSDTR